MKVKIKNNQRRIAVNKKQIVRLAEQTLKSKGINQAELSILLVSRQRIRALNKKYRGADRATDVLAFSMREGKTCPLHTEILGDVVICPEMAEQSAKTFHTSKQDELDLYLVHGILHLLGYQDTRLKSRCAMKKEELRILNKINSKCKSKT